MTKNSTLVVIFVFFATSYSTSGAQDATKNERFKRAFTQLVSAMALKRGIDEDEACREKRYPPLPTQEIIAAIPSNGQNDDDERQKIRSMFDKLPVDVILPDGRPMYKATYQQAIDASRSTGLIPNTADGHCDVIHTVAINIFQKSKNNFKPMDK